MQMVSKAALAVVLALGAGMLVAAPVMAKDKKDQAAAAPAPATYSEAFRKAAVPAQDAAKAQDWAKLEADLPAVEAVAQTDDEKLLASQWRLQIDLHAQNYAHAQTTLEALINNPKLPQEARTLGYFNFLRGSLAMQDKKYADSLPYLLKAAQIGYADSQPYEANGPAGSGELSFIRLALAYFETGNPAEGAKWVDKAIATEEAAGRKAPEQWYKYVWPRLFNAGDRTGATTWVMREVTAYPTAENWRDAVMNISRSVNAQKQALSKGDKLDLFRLLRATNALADQNDYDDYANLAQNSGLPWETKAIILEGRANGKIPASDSTATALLNNAQAGLKSEMPLSVYEAKAAAAATGAPSVQTADAYLASGDYAKAATLYRAGLAKGGVVVDTTNNHLGIALARSGDKAGALEAFGKVQGAPESDIAKSWVAWVKLNP